MDIGEEKTYIRECMIVINSSDVASLQLILFIMKGDTNESI